MIILDLMLSFLIPQQVSQTSFTHLLTLIPSEDALQESINLLCEVEGIGPGGESEEAKKAVSIF
jgi:hypothetical protein